MMTRAKTTKACNAMRKMGYSGKIVRSVLKELLKLYDNNWMYIEEDGYQVLVDALLENGEPKEQSNEEKVNAWSKDEDEDNEPLLKRYKKRNKTNQSSIPKCSNDVENKYHGKQKMAESFYETDQFMDIELMDRKRKRSISPSFIVLESSDVLDGNLALEETPFEENLHLPMSDVPGNCSTYPEVIDLDAEDICTAPYLLLNDHSTSMNYIQSDEADKNKNGAQDSLMLDIASSSGGEMKISLLVKPSLRSDFHVPCLEALLKHVEKRHPKLYKNAEPGFSILNLMKEVCECFLAAGTTSTVTENVRNENVIPPAVGFDGQLDLFSKPTISNEQFQIQNLFQVSPQIPRFPGPVHLDLSHCMISLSVDVDDSNAKWKKILDLDCSWPSSSKKTVNYIEDITRGQEPYEISLINDVDAEEGPTFGYIPKNVKFQNANITFRLAGISKENCCSNCSGDCLAQEIPCACAGKSGGEFGYKPGGLLKDKFLEDAKLMDHSGPKLNLFYCRVCPLGRANRKSKRGQCKGHVVRKFIKECWYKCGCHMKCGNRVVQRGITAKLQVFMTRERKGWGLRTLEDLPKGAFICEYVGEVVTYKELFESKLPKSGDNHTYPVLLDAGWSSGGVIKDEEALFLDATSYGNVARFINHRCFDANLVEIPVEVETPDHRYYHLAFFTTRKVNAMEELTWDYGINFKYDQPAFDCYCGSKLCRDHGSMTVSELNFVSK